MAGSCSGKTEKIPMKIKQILKNGFAWLFLFLGISGILGARWYLLTYGDIGFNSILFTLMSGLGGVESRLVMKFLRFVVFRAALITAFLMAVLWNPTRFRVQLRLPKSGKVFPVSPADPRWSRGICWGLSAVLIFAAALLIRLPQWVIDLGNTSHLLEENYAAPESVRLSFPEEKRNLIYIYLESMETTFLSEEQGGAMEVCEIPELYALAEENTNFSFHDGVGGWPEINGTTWTTAGIVSQSSGLPLLMPFQQNDNGHLKQILPGVTTLWDLLAEQGYYQTVMLCGEGGFSGLDRLFAQHGVDKFYDYETAAREGAIPEGYEVWWGYEDERLYAYARQELSRISQGDQPFAFTLVTADTHFPDGYVCELCGDAYPEQYENVYACADRQIAGFVEWLQEQPFYENTTVVICGDHLSMDADFMARKGIAADQRSVYNCILNAAVPSEQDREKNRVYTPMDLFPTTLAALGCTVEGDRLGIGTNLYSRRPTLAEELGVVQLNKELNRSTIPYMRLFMMEQ